MSDQSWREAYAIRNKVIEKRGVDARTDASAVADAVSIANAGYRDAIKQDSSVPLRPEDQQKKLKDDAYKASIEKGGLEGFGATVAQTLDRPVIKQVVDGISTLGYASANAWDHFIKQSTKGMDQFAGYQTDDRGKRLDDTQGSPDIAGGIGSLLDSLNPIPSLGKGVSAGIGGNANDVKTFAPVIKDVQHSLGVPDDQLEGGLNGAIQGWGGLALDIGADPASWLTVGAVPIVKGLAKGAVEGGGKAKAIAKAGIKEQEAVGKVVTPELQKIAENTKGRLGTAIQEAKFNKKEWDAFQNERYAQKASIKAGKKDKTHSAEGLSVGVREDVAGTDAAMAARNAATIEELGKELSKPTKSIPTEAVPVPVAKAGGMQNGMDIPAVVPKTEPELIQEVKDTLAGAPAASTKTSLGDINLERDLLGIGDKAAEVKIAKTPAASAVEDIVDGAPIIADAPRKMNLQELQSRHDVISGIENAIAKPLYPNAASLPARAFSSKTSLKEFGIDPKHFGLNKAQLVALHSPVTARTLNSALKGDKANRTVLRKVLELMGVNVTGESTVTAATMTKAIDDFMALRTTSKKELSAAKKEVLANAAKKPTRVEEISTAQKTAIDAVKTNVADVAEELGTNPTVFDEAAQSLRRGQEFAAARQQEMELLKADAHMAAAVKNDPTVLPDIAHRAVIAAVERQLKDAPFKTNGAFRTLDNFSTSTGGAWKPERWGTNSQLALHNEIIKGILPLMDNVISKSVYKVGLKKKLYMSTLKIADKELRAAGIEPFLNYVSASGQKINLSLYDILGSIDAYAPKALQDTLFTSAIKGFRPTDFANAVEHLMHMRAKGIPEDKIRSRVRSAFTAFLNKKGVSSQTVHGRPTTNDLSRETAAQLANRAARDLKLSPVETARHVRDRANIITDAIMLPKVYEELAMRSVINHAMHNSKIGKQIDDLANETIIDLNTLAQTSSTGEALSFLSEVTKDLRNQFSKEDLAKAQTAFDMKMATIIKEPEKASLVQAEKRVAVATNTTSPAQAKEFIKNAAKVGNDGKTGAAKVAETNAKSKGPTPAAVRAQEAVNSTHVKEVKDTETEVLATLPEPRPADPATGEPEVFAAEQFEMVAATIATDTMRKIHPIQSLVNPRLGLSNDVYRAVNSGLHSIARQQNTFHSTLLAQMGKRGHEALSRDFTLIQDMAAKHLAEKGMDVPFVLPEGVADSTKEMFDIMSVLFDTSKRNVFVRNGIGAAHLNGHLEAAGLKNKTWRFDTEASPVENSQMWTQWKGITDAENGVMDFMSKVHGATVKAAQDIAIAASFSKNFGKATYEPGMVKLAWSDRPKDSSSIFGLIDTTLYYPKEIASQVRGLDRLLYESRSINTSTHFGKFIVNVFDPVTNALKASQTTVRPGHWVISFAGDLLRNQIAGVNSVVPYKHAVGIMRAAHLDPDEMIGNIRVKDMTPVQRSIAQYKKDSTMSPGFELSTGDSKGATFYINGKKTKILYKDLGSIMNDGIIIPPHRGGGGGAIEDRFMGENITGRLAKGIGKVTDAVTDNKHFSLNKWAAKRDNLMRISLAIDFASKRKWKSVDEMKAAMEDYVTKWAPLSTDFTAFEAKVARRTMLYYTWLRGITPRIIDAAMTQPGVATAIPKALYNAALANGLHPESIGNPFDPEMLVPDYYAKNVLGPQWQDDFGTWGLNPSSPIIEVADTFAGLNPMHPVDSGIKLAQTGFGMSTPFIKAPAEMGIFRTSNGIPIKSDAQYALDNFGGSWLSTLSRATGKRVGMGGIVDRTDNAAKDTPEDQLNHAKLQGLNFTFGGKLTDFQSPGALRSAVYSQRDQAKKDAGR